MQEETIALDVARRYYHRDESKTEIGRELGLSRFQVARLLADARRSGLVRIEIGAPGRVDTELSAALVDALGIERAVVVHGDPGSLAATFAAVGAALAPELERVAVEGAVIGLAWSRAVPAMADAVRSLPPCTVVQLAGAVQPPPELPGSVEVVRAVAAAAAGEAVTLYAPLVVPNGETAAGLRRQPEIAQAVSWWSKLDIAVLSVGAWREGSSAVHGLVDAPLRAELDAAGTVGEVSGRAFGRSGRAIRTGLDARVLGATLQQLRKVPVRLTTAAGAHRRDATLGAVRAGLVGTLVVDDALARSLLDAPG